MKEEKEKRDWRQLGGWSRCVEGVIHKTDNTRRQKEGNQFNVHCRKKIKIS